jgi:hypothetical protein
MTVSLRPAGPDGAAAVPAGVASGLAGVAGGLRTPVGSGLAEDGDVGAAVDSTVFGARSAGASDVGCWPPQPANRTTIKIIGTKILLDMNHS